MTNWIILVLLAIVLTLGFFQVKSCNDHTAQNLQQDKELLKKQSDSLASLNKAAMINDGILRMRYSLDTARFLKQIDSLTQREKSAKQLASSLQVQLNQTISDLKDAVMSGDTASQLKTIEDLKRQLADLIDNEHFQGDISQSKESVYLDQLAYRDSVITQKNKTIDICHSNFAGEQDILAKVSADLDAAIVELKKGKKVSIWRTIGEAALVIALIFKH